MAHVHTAFLMPQTVTRFQHLIVTQYMYMVSNSKCIYYTMFYVNINVALKDSIQILNSQEIEK